MPRPSRSARIQAFVDLMDKPVLLAGADEESFRRATYFERELRDWFHGRPGWHLERNREMMRLVRTPGALAESTTVLTGAGGRPVGMGEFREPLEYVLFTLVLYVAENAGLRGRAAGGMDSRFLLSELAGHLLELVQSDPFGLSLDLTDISHRFALARVVRLLQRLGALICLDGSAEDWAERNSQDVDVLYAFTEVVHRLAPRIPSREELDGLAAVEPAPVRHAPCSGVPAQARAWRALLLGPVLLAHDDPEAFAHVVDRRLPIGRELSEVFGWQLDLYHGAARILRDSHAQDAGAVLLQCRRAEFGAILVLCDRLQDMVRDGARTPDADDGLRMPASALTSHLLELRQQHLHDLAAGLGTCGPQEFLERVLGVMRGGGMLRGPDERGDVYLTPLCALYRGTFLEAPGDQGVSADEHELFAG